MIDIPNKDLCYGISREDMPQIASDDVRYFLNSHHVAYNQEAVCTSTLVPTQSEFNLDKIVNMSDEAKRLPILISADNYVLDGHHRWLANHMSGTDQAVIKLPWNTKESFDKMHGFKKSFTKAVHEDAPAAVSIGGGAMDNTFTPKPKKIKSFKTWRRTEK